MTAFRLALRGQLRATIKRDLDSLDRAIGKGVDQTSRSLQLSARDQVNRAFGRGGRGRRRRVGNAIRRRRFDDGRFQKAAIVYSRFGRKEGGTFVDYLVPHTRGATIRAKSGRWLFLSRERGRSRRRRLVVRFAKNLAFVNVKPGVALLVRRTRTRSTILGVLFRKVRIKKKLDFRRDVDRERTRLAERVVEAWT